MIEFTFKDYLMFCKDFKLNPSHYDSLIIFKTYCGGDFDVIFSII